VFYLFFGLVYKYPNLLSSQLKVVGANIGDFEVNHFYIHLVLGLLIYGARPPLLHAIFSVMLNKIEGTTGQGMSRISGY